MSESKHTPGPWDAFRGRVIYAVDGLPVAEAACCSLADTIDAENETSEWRDLCEQSMRGNREAAANAALISAAPDLLRACEVALRQICPGDYYDDLAIEQLRAALRKAGGEA